MVPEASKKKAFGGQLFDIFGNRLFLDFGYPYCTKCYILMSGGYPNCVIFGEFFEGALRKASGTRFWEILDRFWGYLGWHFGGLGGSWEHCRFSMDFREPCGMIESVPEV